jgi:hypothetical protein
MRSAYLACLVLLGCGGDVEISSATFDRILLQDVQGLWGGQNLYIASDGTVVAQIITPNRGLQERRIEFSLPPAKISELIQILNEARFFSIQTEDRLGEPDEAHPTLIVKLKTGQRCMVQKWDGDKHVEFDSIYKWLLAVVDLSKQNKPVYEGPLDWTWKPDGY